MMLEAMTALLSLPRVISHRLSRSRMTVTRKRFSCSSTMLPLMDPMAQHSVFRAPQLHSMPFSCAAGPREDQLRDPGTAEALQSPEAVSWLICHADGADVLAKHVQRAPAGTLRLRAAQSRHAWPRVSGLLDEMRDHQICTYASLRCMGWQQHGAPLLTLPGSWAPAHCLSSTGNACEGFPAQLTCSRSFSSIWLSVSSWSRWLRYTRVSCMVLYRASVSVSFIVSRTMFPFSSSTTMTCSRVKKV